MENLFNLLEPSLDISIFKLKLMFASKSPQFKSCQTFFSKMSQLCCIVEIMKPNTQWDDLGALYLKELTLVMSSSGNFHSDVYGFMNLLEKRKPIPYLHSDYWC